MAVDRKDSFKILQCPQLAESQTACHKTFKMTPAQASKSGYTAWDRGHLVPVNPNRFHEEAMSTTFYCVNIAPQEPYTNQVSWRTIEDRSLAYFKTFSGLIITGTCPNNVQDGDTVEGYLIPACFWKLICYKENGTGAHRVVGFFGNNTLISPTTIDRAARTADVTKPRSQGEMLDLIGSESYVKASWIQAGAAGRDSSTNLPNPTTCITRKSLPDEVASEWGKIMYLDMASLEDYVMSEE